jgi:hypothetical protein
MSLCVRVNGFEYESFLDVEDSNTMKFRVERAADKGGKVVYHSCPRRRLFILAWCEVGDVETGYSVLVLPFSSRQWYAVLSCWIV